MRVYPIRLRTAKILIGVFLLFIQISAFAGPCSYTPTITGSSAVCFGSTSIYKANKTSGLTYQWSVTNGTILSGSTGDSIVVSWTTPANGIVKVVENSGTCKDSVTKNVFVGITKSYITPGKYSLLSSASQSGKTVTLVTATNYIKGAAWYNKQIDLDNGFDFYFEVNICGGADGMMFVLQNNDTTAIGLDGGSMGYYGASGSVFSQSLGVELDIYNNSSPNWDTSASHIALVKNKSYNTLRPQYYVSNSIGGRCTNVPFRISWNFYTKEFQVWYDNVKIYSYYNDLKKNIFGGNSKVWFGFTGANGGVNSVQSFFADSLFTYTKGLKGLSIIKGSPFGGKFNSGTLADPDGMCKTDTLTYEVTPPTGLTNSDFNSKWGLTNLTIKTLKGTSLPITQLKVVNPTSTVNGKIKLFPSSSFMDSTFIATATFRNLQTLCDTVITRYIIYTAPAKSVFTLSSSSFCLGSSITLTNSSTPIKNVKYLWNFGNGDTSSKQTPVYKYKVGGVYNISLVISTPGCKDSSTKSVYVGTATGSTWAKGKPYNGYYNAGTVSDPDFACVKDTESYDITPPTGVLSTDYGTKWTVSSVTVKTLSGAAVNDTFTKTPSSTTNYSVNIVPGLSLSGVTIVITAKVKSLAGACDSTMTRYITVGYSPKAWFGFIPVCVGKGAVAFSDSSTITSGLLGRKWDFGDGTSATTKFPQHTYALAGKYNVTLTVSSDKGCTDAVTRVVEVYTPPKVKFGYIAACVNKPVIFSDSTTTSGTIKTWNWKFGDGGTSTLKNPKHTYAKSGAYTVTLIVDASTGCTDSIKKTVNVFEKATADFTFVTNCQYKPVNFTSTSKPPTGGTLTYKWDFDDGTTSTLANPSHTYTNPKTYQVKLIAISSTGCNDTIIKPVVLYPNPKVVFGPASLSQCVGSNVVFIDSTAPQGQYYLWSFGDNTTSVDKLGKHVYTKAGTYEVKLKVTSDKFCTDSTSRIINVYDKPKADFSASDVCLGKPTLFSNSSTTPGGANYLWKFDDGGISTDKDPQHTYATAKTYNVKLKVTGLTGGCSDSIIKVITVKPSPTISFTINNITTRQKQFNPSDGSLNSYKWYFGDNDSSIETSPTHTYAVLKGKFLVRLIVTNSAGCTAEYSDTARVGQVDIGPITESPFKLNVYPNPFENSSTIRIELDKKSKVSIDLYDLAGHKISNIANGTKEKGIQTFEINGIKEHLSSGSYMLHLQINDSQLTREIFFSK